VTVIDKDWTVRELWFWSGLYWELLWLALGLRWYLGTDRHVLPSASAVSLYLA